MLDPTSLSSLFGQPPSSPLIADYIAALARSAASSSSPLTGHTSTHPRSEIHTYSDATYHNYPSLGLSLCFTPLNDHKRQASASPKQQVELGLDSVDLFLTSPAPPPTAATTPQAPSASGLGARRTALQAKTKKEWYDSARPPLPIELHFPSSSLPAPAPPPAAPARSASSPVATAQSLSGATASSTTPASLTRPLFVSINEQTTGKELVGCLGEPSKKGSGGWTGVWLEWGSVELVRSPSGADAVSSGGDDLNRDAADKRAAKSAGASGGTVRLGIMVQLRDTGDPHKQAPGGVWDKAAGWGWESIKLFRSEENGL